MLSIRVKVSGPGQCINTEMKIIEDALRAAGYTLNVENEYPPEPPSNCPVVGHKSLDRSKWTINLVADHQPWGG